MEKNHISIQEKKPKITIKLIGDANDLSELVNDINSQYHLESQSNNQSPVKLENSPNFEPLKKKLKMKEEVLSQRVVLVVPKNSPSHYPPNPRHESKLIRIEDQKKTSETNSELINSKNKNDQQNKESCRENIDEGKNESNVSMQTDKNAYMNYMKLQEANRTCGKNIRNRKRKHDNSNNNHNTGTMNSEQTVKSKSSPKLLNGKKIKKSESTLSRDNMSLITESFEVNKSINSTYSRKKSKKADDKTDFITLSDYGKHSLQFILNKALNKNLPQKAISSKTPTVKILRSPIVLRRSHPINHFQANQLSNREQKTILNTDSTNGKTVKANMLPSQSFSSVKKTSPLIGSKLVNTTTMNSSPKIIKPVFCKRDLDSNSTSLTRNETTKNKLLSPENIIVTPKNHKHLLRNTKIDFSQNKYSPNSSISESPTKSKSEHLIKVIPLRVINHQTKQSIVDNKEKNLPQESNNHEFTNSLESPEKKKLSVSLDLNKTINHVNNNKQITQSPQIKVNGLMIRAPDPNLLNNSALKEKILEFRQSNRVAKKVTSPSDKEHSSIILPSEVSESLVSTTTVEASQSDKNTKDCQCDQLRQEVDEQWKLITHLKSLMNKKQDNSDSKNEPLAEEDSQFPDDKDVSIMIMKELDETNKKIAENLRKELIRNKKLKILVKHKNIRIKQLEDRLNTYSKVCEDTEKKATYLRNQLKSSTEVRNATRERKKIVKITQ